ncbi:MAG: very short patch repair endonuclease [Wolinella sp.]
MSPVYVGKTNYRFCFAILFKTNQTVDILDIQAMTKSEAMAKIKSKNTSIEILLRKQLWMRGFRYRINSKKVFGCPDMVFNSKKVAIFCDGSFWHGRKFINGEQFKTNQIFWENKILRNIQRDIEVTARLKKEGWTVLRFWDTDIKNNISSCVEQIEDALRERNDKNAKKDK